MEGAPTASGCVFFSRQWALEDAPGSERFPGSGLARAILRLGEGPPLAARLRVPRRDGHKRVERASLLLREALRREREGVGRHHGELWRLIHEEWMALGTSAQARDFLRELAVSIGIPREAVDAEVDAVSRAIPNELLPGVHALVHSGLRAGAPSRERLHLKEWRNAVRDNPQASPVLRSALLAQVVISAREAVQKASYRSALAHYWNALELLPPSWSRTLLAHEACLAAEQWVGSLKNFSCASLEKVLAKLEKWSAQLPHHFGLRRLRAAVHHLHLVHELPPLRRFSQASSHLMKGWILEPLASIPTPHSKGAATPREPEGLASFLRTREGMALADETRTAALGEAAFRLGLLPSEPGVLPAVSALCLAFAREEGARVDVLRERLLREHPLLARVPWGLLEELHASGFPIRAEVLAVSLPAPPPFSLDTSSTGPLAEGWRRTCEQGIAAGPSSGRRGIDRCVLYPWLLSAREPVTKAAALVGVLLLSAGGAGLSLHAWEASLREEAFQRFVAASQAEEPSRVAESARDFLRHDARGGDPRLEQVVRGYQEAVLREAIDAARAGDSARAERLSRESAEVEARLERSGGAS